MVFKMWISKRKISTVKLVITELILTLYLDKVLRAMKFILNFLTNAPGRVSPRSPFFLNDYLPWNGQKISQILKIYKR